MLALRCKATGPGGRRFPALDADIWMTPAGAHSARCAGRGPGQAVFHRVADATVRSLLARVADVLARSQESAGAVLGTGLTGAAARRAAVELS